MYICCFPFLQIRSAKSCAFTLVLYSGLFSQAPTSINEVICTLPHLVMSSYVDTASNPKFPYTTSICPRYFKSSDGENFFRRSLWTTATGKEAPKGNIIGLEDAVSSVVTPLRNIPAAMK